MNVQPEPGVPGEAAVQQPWLPGACPAFSQLLVIKAKISLLLLRAEVPMWLCQGLSLCPSIHPGLAIASRLPLLSGHCRVFTTWKHKQVGLISRIFFSWVHVVVWFRRKEKNSTERGKDSELLSIGIFGSCWRHKGGEGRG